MNKSKSKKKLWGNWGECTMQSHLAIAPEPNPTKVWQASTINRKITCPWCQGAKKDIFVQYSSIITKVFESFTPAGRRAGKQAGGRGGGWGDLCYRKLKIWQWKWRNYYFTLSNAQTQKNLQHFYKLLMWQIVTGSQLDSLQTSIFYISITTCHINNL